MAPPRPRLLLGQRQTPAVMARLQKDFTLFAIPETQMTPTELVAAAREFAPEAIMVSSPLPIRAADVAQLPPSVRVIATVSVGTDHLDIPAILGRGIALSNTPDVLTDCNADLALMLILAASRRAAEYRDLMKQGWGRGLAMDEMLGVRVTGKTLGIIGMGRIGRAVAQRARGFGMKILYSNRRRLGAEDEHGAQYFATPEEMLPHCDILSLHLPASAASDGMINARMLALLPRGAIFVNAARGALVDEQALIAALRDGQIAAAGLDVFRNEPTPDQRLLDLPNVFATPHVGSATMETRTDMGMLAVDNIEAALANRPLPTPVTA